MLQKVLNYFSDLYSKVKILDLSAKPFFPCANVLLHLSAYILRR